MSKCFLVQLKPFDRSQATDMEIQEFQKKSIEKGISGMGWSVIPSADNYLRGSEELAIYENSSGCIFLADIPLDTKEKFNLFYKCYERTDSSADDSQEEEISNKGLAGIKRAYNCYKIVEKGDYLLTRLYRTGICYVGKVTSEAYHEQSSQICDRYSWVVKVKWYPVGPFSSLPNALRGLYSSSYQPTIMSLNNEVENPDDLKRKHLRKKKRVETDEELENRKAYEWDRKRKNENARFLIECLYNEHCKCEGSEAEKAIEKKKLTSESWWLTLDPYDLEDLVAQYMIRENEGYRLIPSSCKSSEPAIEFIMTNGIGTITCQVKNNRKIDVAIYNELKDKYDKIYLFSGVGYDNSKEYDKEKIELIDPEDLFKIIKEEFGAKEGYFYNMLEKYYVI